MSNKHPSRNVSRVRPREVPLPTSGEIIGFLAKTLEWSFEPVKSRTWRNFTAGKRVSPETRQAVFRELAGFLIPPEAEEDPGLHEAHRGAMEHLLSSNADWWDSLLQVVTHFPSDGQARLTTEVALRLATSELAQRFAGVLAIARLPSPTEEIPHWLQENSVRDALRALLLRAEITREALARACNVSKQAVDKWLDMPLPPDRRIKSIVNVALGRLPSDERRRLSEQLLRLRLMAKLAERLAALIGWAELKELGRAFFRLTRAAREALEQVSFASDEERERQLVELLRMGSDSSLAGAIQPQIEAAESNRHWAQVARLSSDDWLKRLALARMMPKVTSWLREVTTQKKARHIDPQLLDLMERVMMRLPIAPQPVIHTIPLLRTREEADRFTYEFYVERLDDIQKQQDRVGAIRRLERIIDLLGICLELRPDSLLKVRFERLIHRYHCERVLRLLEDFHDTERGEDSARMEARRMAVVQALEEMIALPAQPEAASSPQEPRAEFEAQRASVEAIRQALAQGDARTALRLATCLSAESKMALDAPDFP